jgi:hypothetical protein
VAPDAGPNGNQMYDEVVAAILINQSLFLIFSTITDSAAHPDNATEEMDDTDGTIGTPLPSSVGGASAFICQAHPCLHLLGAPLPSIFVVASAGKSRSKRKLLHPNLCYGLTDVPPQPNSPPDVNPGRPTKDLNARSWTVKSSRLTRVQNCQPARQRHRGDG